MVKSPFLFNYLPTFFFQVPHLHTLFIV